MKVTPYLMLYGRGDEAIHMLNGEVVLRLTGASPSEGKIIVQSEGAEMYVRKIELRPLP